MRTSTLFVAKTNIKFFKIHSVSISDMDTGQREGKGREIEPVFTFFLDKGRSIFHDFV